MSGHRPADGGVRARTPFVHPRGYDVFLLDLDGTLVLAGTPLPHAAEQVVAATRRGITAMVVTNNASRSPEQVAERLARDGINVQPDHIVTSSQAGARALADRHPAGAAVLVIGAPALVEAVEQVGLRPVTSADDDPVAVIQGHSPDTGWRQLAEGCLAIRAGADWVATNADRTLPTDRGQLPGNGAMVAALRAATDAEPTVTGKPQRALIDLAVARSGACRPLMIGDRLETDIDAAHAGQVDSLMVLTGVSTVADVLAREPILRPTFVATDLRALSGEGGCVRCADHPDDADLAAALAALDTGPDPTPAAT